MCVAILTISNLPKWAEGMHIPVPVVGSEYEVCNTIQRYGMVWYELAGFIETELDARAFAILPGLTADEIDDIEKEGVVR